VPKPASPARSDEYLTFIRRQPCMVCGTHLEVVPHHYDPDNTATGRKVSDYFTVPMCARHHREFHDHGIVALPGGAAAKLAHQRVLLERFLSTEGF
jgi:hypothetical protein